MIQLWNSYFTKKIHLFCFMWNIAWFTFRRQVFFYLFWLLHETQLANAFCYKFSFWQSNNIEIFHKNTILWLFNAYVYINILQKLSSHHVLSICTRWTFNSCLSSCLVVLEFMFIGKPVNITSVFTNSHKKCILFSQFFKKKKIFISKNNWKKKKTIFIRKNVSWRRALYEIKII